MALDKDELRRRSLIRWGSAVIALVALLLGVTYWNAHGQSAARSRPLTLKDIPFDGGRAYDMLKALCEIGPRVSGTKGMLEQQELLEKHFTNLGGKVTYQRFDVRHPLDGSKVPLANMRVEWHPDRQDRILICCHYDTRPFPDNDHDPRKRKGVFVGANDGASGAALLTELGRHMADLRGKVGVDFLLFDGEELVYDNARDKYFLGSEYFARDYVANPPAHHYRNGVLVDMIGDSELQILQELHGMRDWKTRELIGEIWEKARKLGVNEFVARGGYEIRDDHLALINIAKIPTCDIIDFDYPRPRAQTYWHTTSDIPAKCSALSLAKVGWVILEWLKQK